VSAAPLLEEVLEAHGGRERWAAARTIEAELRSGGLLPRTRFPGNRLAAYRATLSVHEPRVSLDPFPGEGKRAIYERGGARIEGAGGAVISVRENARAAFAGLSGVRRNLRWDPLDTTYFAGYALWNYLTAPLLLTRPEVELSEGAPRREGDETWRRLDARFGPGIDTHSEHQRFYVDREGRLRRHDYTATVVGGWARAAHMLADHRSFDGLLFATRRWVRPVGPGARPLPFPTMVRIEVTSVSVQGD
jgi:hypothetical protein